MKSKRTRKYPLEAEGRVCAGCGVFKTWDRFSWDNKAHTHRHAYCKECVAARVRTDPRNLERTLRWNKEHPDKVREAQQKYAAKVWRGYKEWKRYQETGELPPRMVQP